MHIDFKITTWERIEVPQEKEAEVKQLIESGKINSADDLSNFLDGVPSERLMETDKQMTPEEQNGFATIELFNQSGESPVWKNGK